MLFAFSLSALTRSHENRLVEKRSKEDINLSRCSASAAAVFEFPSQRPVTSCDLLAAEISLSHTYLSLVVMQCDQINDV
jgi:hypothetical protein